MEMKAGPNLDEFSESYGSKSAVLPTMITMLPNLKFLLSCLSGKHSL
jgi:hypothetical protein